MVLFYAISNRKPACADLSILNNKNGVEAEQSASAGCRRGVRSQTAGQQFADRGLRYGSLHGKFYGKLCYDRQGLL